MRTLLFTACLLLGVVLPGHAQVEVKLHELKHLYVVRINAALNRMDVHVCFDRMMPEALRAGSAEAADFLIEMNAVFDGRRVALRPNGRQLPLPQVPDDLCVDYQVDIDAITAKRTMRHGLQVEDSRMIGVDYWLWRPPSHSPDSEIVIRFELPEGVTVSAPWEALPDEAPMSFRMGKAPMYWRASIAVGHLYRELLPVPGTRLRVAMLGNMDEAARRQARDWIGGAASAVASVTGRFPVPASQVLVIPVAEGQDAAPWADVVRGGAPAARFLMNQNASAADFRDDWVATHELSHMLLPFVSRCDAWLSEGFASYYQNIARARTEMLSPLMAWQKLHEGFMRGQRDDFKGSLADASERLRADKAYMRVYWSGAAIALLADYELRAGSNNQWSLDRVLAEFGQCCRPSYQMWRAKKLFAEFDRISGTEVFSRLYATHVYSAFFPKLDLVYAELGLRVKSGQIQMIDQAPHRDIRDAIMLGNDKTSLVLRGSAAQGEAQALTNTP